LEGNCLFRSDRNLAVEPVRPFQRPFRVAFKSVRPNVHTHLQLTPLPNLADFTKELSQQLFIRLDGNRLLFTHEVPVMLSMFVVVAEHSAIVARIELVIDKGEIVFGDSIAGIDPYSRESNLELWCRRPESTRPPSFAAELSSAPTYPSTGRVYGALPAMSLP